jgi:uncharacterized integral membrane protein (TIGR00698 family)
VNPVLVAVVLGLVLGNVVALPARTRAGIDLAAKRLLRIGVVLLGARLSLGDVAAIGLPSVGVVLACMAAAFACVALGARLTGIPPRLAVLIAVGTAVCGNSAIVATAPVVDAEEREISFAVGTITIFGTLALLLFPLAGHVAGMPDRAFGFWAGLSINDTSQVVATGAAYSEEALAIATVVKLVRNALMAPLILGIAWWANRRGAGAPGEDAKRGARKAFPLFLLGFLALAALRSAGVLGAAAAAPLTTLATVLITIAIAAVGLGTSVARLRTVGAAPFLVGMSAAVVLALVGAMLASAL